MIISQTQVSIFSGFSIFEATPIAWHPGADEPVVKPIAAPSGSLA